MSRARAPRRGGGDRGDVEVWFCVIIALAGGVFSLLVELGARVTAATRADMYSAEAARAASISVGPASQDTAAAARAAQPYLAQAGAAGIVSVLGP